MSLSMLFVLLLVLSFGVIAWVLRPTKTEADLQRHLREIGGMSAAVDAEGGTILRRHNLSSIPQLNEILRQVPGCLKLQLFIQQAGSQATVGMLLFGSLLAALGFAWIGSLLAPALAIDLILGVIAGLLPCLYLLTKRVARFRRFNLLLPEAVDLMSRALKAGHAVTSAIEMVAQEISDPVSTEFRIVFDEQNLGLPMREAMLNLANRMPLDDIRFFTTAVLVQRETGGNLTEVLDKAAALMRERIRLKGQLRIYSAQGRLTGVFLCAMPFVLFFLLCLADFDYEKRLWTAPLGLHLIYAGAVLMALGIFTIRKIIDIRV